MFLFLDGICFVFGVILVYKCEINYIFVFNAVIWHNFSVKNIENAAVRIFVCAALCMFGQYQICIII